MMLTEVASFEFRHQLRNPVFWVSVGIFFLMGFGSTASSDFSFGTPGAVHENSPYTMGILLAVYGIFYQFVITSFVANAVLRDDVTGIAPIIRSTPLTKNPLIIGRFLGGLGISIAGFMAVPFGMAAGSFMPWVDPETIGSNGFFPYLWQFCVVALPNIFLSAALLLALATSFRSLLASFLGVAFLFMAYLVTSIITSDRPEWLPYVAKFEPMGFAAIADLTRYWTTAELNSRVFPLEGNFLFNRAFVTGVGLLVLAATVARFSMAERAPSRRRLRKLGRKQAKGLKDRGLTSGAPPLLARATFDRKTTWTQFRSRLVVEILQVLKSPGLVIILLLCLFMAFINVATARTIYGTGTYPLTANVIDSLRLGYPAFVLMIAAFYGGELVWRERDRRFNEIVDSAPTRDWVMIVPKVLAILIILTLVNATGVVAGIGIQLAKGVTSYSLGKYVSWFLLPSTVDMLLVAILAVFFQILSPNKYVGWALLLGWSVLAIFMGNVGYSNLLYNYGQTPAEPLSDMNGTGGFWVGAAWARFYWLSIGMLLLLLAHLLWPRGTVTALGPRLNKVAARTGRGELAIGAIVLVMALGSGTFIHYNIKHLNHYRTAEDREELAADFERLFLRYEDLPQPSITAVRLKVDIFPKKRKLETNGAYALVNRTGRPLSQIHLRTGTDDISYFRLTVDGARRLSGDKRHGYYIFQFDKPLKPGARTMARFASRIWYRGFRNDAPATDVTPNGVFVNNFAIAPIVGMDRRGLLSDRTQRRRQGLPSELRPAKLEDTSATLRNYVGTDWVKSDISVSTDADQLPVAPGDRVSDVTRGNRRITRFVSSAPMHNFFSIQSARYAVARKMHGKVATEIYYHPDHGWNVPVMQRAMAESLDYFQANFGPYQFHHARILEFPGYNSFAQAFAGTIPYSESVGFSADVSDPNDVDYVTYVTAHEMAHQWWAHQAIGANMQGAALTTETLAQYSALMVLRKIHGPDSVRRFLKYELDFYLARRKSEANEELPLIREEDQAYIHYNKGALAMFLLQQRLGEDKVNRALRAFLDQWKFKGPPYHRSVDLVAELRKVATTREQQALISDLFERITLYDFKARTAETRQQGGQWKTTLTVDATKFHADGKGVERKVQLQENVEIGLFSSRPGDGVFSSAEVISVERLPVRNGAQRLVITSRQRPAYAGIDPYNFYVDRNSNDNLVAVGDAR